MTIVPGFIDCHVHVTGGGGEAGFASRTPEAQLGELVNAGVTTFVGILGTDCVTRSTENLLAKTRGLAAGGLTGYCLLGGYQFPPVNDITGSLSRDIMLIPEAIGVGELAISDHRSSNPTVLELSRLAGDVRVAGMLANKAGTDEYSGDSRRIISPV
jgi:beta-aspartyl-dipeptidase (metallo-type)